MSRANLRVAVLSSLIRCAHRIAQDYRKTKILKWTRIRWAFVLYLKTIRSAETIEELVKADCRWNAPLILRSMLDAALDLHVIGAWRGRERELSRMFEYEALEDQYQELKFEIVDRRHKSLDDARRQDANIRRVLDAYEAAAEEKMWNRRSTPPKRWRWYTFDEKLKLCPTFKNTITRLLGFPLKTLGDAAAHSRPIALIESIRSRDGDYVIARKPRRWCYGREFLAFCASILVLKCSGFVVDEFCLDGHNAGLEKAFAQLQRAND